jgi:hypothetical protein
MAGTVAPKAPADVAVIAWGACNRPAAAARDRLAASGCAGLSLYSRACGGAGAMRMGMARRAALVRSPVRARANREGRLLAPASRACDDETACRGGNRERKKKAAQKREREREKPERECSASTHAPRAPALRLLASGDRPKRAPSGPISAAQSRSLLSPEAGVILPQQRRAAQHAERPTAVQSRRRPGPSSAVESRRPPTTAAQSWRRPAPAAPP